jgi:hypothetical protein
MKYVFLFIKWALLVGGLFFWFFVLVNYAHPTIKVYNCDIAEISPDYPIEVRNECRRIISGKSIST